MACLLVLLPGLLAAELVVRGYEARLSADARARATAGLDGVAALIDTERVRTLNNADLAGSRLGLLATQGTAPDTLVKSAGDVRVALRTTLVALLDGSGKTLASDPASNLAFGASWEARRATQGRTVVALEERAPGFAIQAAAPLRVNGAVVPGMVIVAQNLDDGLLNTSLRLSGLDVALIQNGRLVAASRGIRRSFAFASDQSLDGDLLGSGPDRFKRTHLGSETFFLAARTLTSGNREIGTVLVGTSADAAAADVRWARTVAYLAVVIGAAVAAVIGARFGRWQATRVRAVTDRVRAIVPAGQRLHTTAEAEATIRMPAGGWSDLDAAVRDTAAAVVRMTRAQRHQAARLEAVLGSLAEGVIVADEEHRVIFANPIARQLLHLPAGDADPAFDARGLAGEPPAERDASQRVIRSYAAPVLGDGGQPLGYVTVLRDATREQEIEQARSELLGVVSHELQTPLTAIKGALELVVEEDEGHLSRVQRRFLDTIDRNCARMIGLVGDLLDLSRLDAGRLELDSRPLDTPSVVAGSIRALDNLFEQRHQSITLDVPADTPPILGDRRRVEQILTNLLSNASKYTPEGGQIEVTAGADGSSGDSSGNSSGGSAGDSSAGRVWVAVADSGPGIPDSERELVFGRFYRGKEAGRRGEAGSGLGLAIVRSLVELHGGQIRITGPEPGARVRGARFVVELPVAPADSE
jgi:signal transduction histidine kinase